MLKFRIFKSSSIWILATYELGLEGIPYPSPEAELQKAYNAPRKYATEVPRDCCFLALATVPRSKALWGRMGPYGSFFREF